MKKTLFVLLVVLFSLNSEKGNSQVWSQFGGGTGGILDAAVIAFTVYNNQLIAGGNFTSAGGVNANRIAQWNGIYWSPFGNGMNNYVFALTVYNNQIIAGGAFSTAGGVNVNRIARWNGVSWTAFGSGMNNVVYALAVYNNELIAGGSFDTAGGVRVNYIAKWNGTNWSPLGSGMDGIIDNKVLALTVYNNELIAGGHFTTAGGISTSGLAKWNGTSWSALGTSGLGLGEETARAFTIYNGELIVAGGFGSVGGVTANSIAKWNGTNWSQLGDGVGYTPMVLNVLNNELIAGGSFLTAGGISVNRIAKWNGVNWSAMGSGISGSYGSYPSPNVQALTVYNGSLIVGGRFSFAGGDTAKCIARWWTPFSVSGQVRYSDNNQFATDGYVKAIKLDKVTGNIITYDSVQIQPNGTYTLTNVPQDSVDIGVYPNSSTQNDWVMTYYPSTIYWQNATTIYATGNLTSINVNVFRLYPITAGNSVNGKIRSINPYGNLKDVILYAKSGNSYVRCTTSDNNGVYHLNSLPAGNLKIIADRMGFRGDSTNVTVTLTSNLDSVNFALYGIYVGIRKTGEEIPFDCRLFQNYPNPFNPISVIKYQLNEAKFVTLKVFDILGKEIAVLVNTSQAAGTYEVTFDGSALPSGIYFCRMEAADRSGKKNVYSDTKKILLIK